MTGGVGPRRGFVGALALLTPLRCTHGLEEGLCWACVILYSLFVSPSCAEGGGACVCIIKGARSYMGRVMGLGYITHAGCVCV